MNSEKESFNKMVLLTMARIFGIAFSIVIPMYLGRKLPVETYGTYKQLMLFFWFSQVALNLGLDDSAYYFLKWEPKKFPLFCFNALVFNFFVTGILWIALIVFKTSIAAFLVNPAIAIYLPLLGFLIFATVSSMQIEGMLFVGLNRFNERLVVDLTTELLKSLAIIGAFFFYNSIEMALYFLCAIMGVRLLATMVLIHACVLKAGLAYVDSIKEFTSQLKYGLPLGVSRILSNALNMENYYISHFFSLTQFTFYSVGCFENPLVNATRASMNELTNIELVDAMKNNDHQKAVRIWRSMTRKLFLFIIPFVAYMICFANEIIRFIFSDKYLQSVPIFMVFNLFLIVGAVNPEAIFRATSKTQLALRIKVLSLLVGIGLIVAGAVWGGMIWALIGKILAVLLMNCLGLFIGAKLLKTNFLNLFQWRELLGVLIVSVIISLFVRLIFWNSSLIPFLVLALSFLLYVSLHFCISCLFRLIKEDELFHLKSIFTRLLTKGKLILKLS